MVYIIDIIYILAKITFQRQLLLASVLWLEMHLRVIMEIEEKSIHIFLKNIILLST